MCGICGYIAGRKLPRHGEVVHMWRLNETRGGHAHGWATPSQHYKAAGKIPEKITLPPAKNLIMHTRWATHGSADDNTNNHPHTWGPWSIVHNGVLQENPVGNQRSKCDSEQIAKILLLRNKVASPFATIKKMTDSLSGSFRIAILNQFFKDHLWIANDYNTIELAIDPNRQIVFFASEKKDLPKGLWYTETSKWTITQFYWGVNGLEIKTKKIQQPMQQQIVTRSWDEFDVYERSYRTTWRQPEWETYICYKCQNLFQRKREQAPVRLCPECISKMTRRTDENVFDLS